MNRKPCVLLVGRDRSAALSRALIDSGRFSGVVTIGTAYERDLMSGRFDLCLVDPTWASPSAAETIRDLRSRMADVPIVALGPISDPRDVASVFRAGAVDYVHDPRGETLVHALERVLRSTAGGGVLPSGTTEVQETRPPGDMLADTQAQLELFEGTNDLIFTHDLEGRFMSVNPACIRSTGYTREEILSLNVRDVLAPEHVALAESMTRQKLVNGGSTRYEVDLITKSGERLPLDVGTRLVVGDDGPIGVQGIARDMTERRRAEEALRVSEQKLRSLLDNVWLLCVGLDLDGKVDYANPFLLELTGYPRDRVLGCNWFRTFIPASLQAELEQRFQEMLLDVGHAHWEHEILTQTGERRLISWNNVVIHDSRGRLAGMLSIGEDITDRRRIELELERQALHDGLTALPNRVLFTDRLTQALRAARRDGEQVAVLIMDLDRFKEVNDTYGHHVGDLLLQQVGLKLSGIVRDSDTVARLGGDEFAVILRGTGRDGAEHMARRAASALAGRYELEGRAVDTEASIGIALFPEHGPDGAALIREADVAMYVAKRAHLGWSLYAPEHDDNSPTRLAMVADLRQAIARRQLRVHWQPIVPTEGGNGVRAEALLRWEHPEHGFIPPDTFIPLAEHTGLMHEFTLWVLDAAVRQCRHWYDRGLSIGVSVNISPRGLHDPELAAAVSGLLRRHEVAPTRVELEVTESAVMAEPERSMDTLTRLRSMGIRVSIDDFGTGHSSLAYLQRLPMDTVKIDRQFVQNLHVSGDDRVIVKSVVDLAHNLGLSVVAEGVEHEQAASLLRAMKCDYLQGYHFSRPVDSTRLEIWIRNYMRSKGSLTAEAV